MKQPAMCQVLTGWDKYSKDTSAEFLIGVFDDIELAQVARESHTLNNEVVYDYCIEPWVIEGRTEEA
jgi:hypothetical protein